MHWLWIISVGLTDIQFPVWKQDEYGQWNQLQRFQIKRGKAREVHQGLRTLFDNNMLKFESSIPPLMPGKESDQLHLEFAPDPDLGGFMASIKSEQNLYQISEYTDILSSDDEHKLTLYFPKIEPIINRAQEIFTDGSVTVIVLNTSRSQQFIRGSEEPIASGPLVAAYLAERLGLIWDDMNGKVPTVLRSGVSTWLDVLIDNERAEEHSTQQRVVTRLQGILDTWSAGTNSDHSVVVTPSGGIPILKPIIERVPATYFGQANVKLLDSPERSDITLTALDYHSRFIERETLRFYCAEALRRNDFSSAYGLARSAQQQPWADTVCRELGPLLELSGNPLQVNGKPLERFAIYATQIEIRLCMNDVAGALIRLGAFIESVIWKLIASDQRIIDWGLEVDSANECLRGKLNPDHELCAQYNGLKHNEKGPDQHQIVGLTWRWPHWLNMELGGQKEAAQAVNTLRLRYESKNTPSPREFRNLMVHGCKQSIDLKQVRTVLEREALINGVSLPFGRNFLESEKIAHVLSSLDADDLSVNMQRCLQEILNKVVSSASQC